MITIIDAILKINPSAQVSISADDINTLIWENGTTPISKSDIQAKQAELQTAYDNKKYQRDRANEYPSWQDQMDMLWHSIDESQELKTKFFDFYEACKAVKVKYPK